MKGSLFFLLFLSIFSNDCKNRLSEERPANAVHYVLDKSWPALPAGFKLGNPAGIGIDTNGNVLVFRRAGRTWPLILPMPQSVIRANTILVLDPRSGTL